METELQLPTSFPRGRESENLKQQKNCSFYIQNRWNGSLLRINDDIMLIKLGPSFSYFNKENFLLNCFMYFCNFVIHLYIKNEIDYNKY